MRSRFIPLVLALLAASAFAFAMQTAWWTSSDVTLGPFGSRNCFGGECRESGLGFIGGTDLWMRSAVATRAGGFIAMFMLIVVAGALAARRIPRLMARAAIVSILTATVTGVYFLVAFPGLGNANISIGVYLFIAAIVIGTAASILALRLRDDR